MGTAIMKHQNLTVLHKDEPDDNAYYDFTGLIPESWCCVDCGLNTAPGLPNRREAEIAAVALGERWKKNEASFTIEFNGSSEVHTVP